MKLKTKIQLFSSLFMLVLIVLVNASIYILFYKISINNELNNLTDQTNTLVETINENRDIQRNELLRAFLPADGMIRVIDKNNKVMTTVTKDESYRNLHVQFQAGEKTEVIANSAGKKIGVMYKPIIIDSGEIMTLEVSTHLTTVENTMRTLLYVLVAASILMLIPTVIAGNILSRFILQPIKELIQTMQENKRRVDWQTIPIKSRSKDELYEMEQTFNEMIETLKENYEKQELFVSDASHELKTPISIIKSYAQLLQRRGVKPEVFKESIQAIDSEADRMDQLVKQMLLLAKNQNDHPYERINFIQLIEKTAKTFQDVYHRNITLKIKDDPIEIYGNKDQLEQVLYILMDNAMKYSENEINIELGRKNEDAQLKVIDFGQGIPESEQAYIFDRFYRVDKARTRETGGTGLGLAIAKTITEQHGGSIQVASKQGEGSTFTLQLPFMMKD